LYVPESFLSFDASSFASDIGLPELGALVLAPFLAGDPLEKELPAIASAAFDFPAPLRFVRSAKVKARTAVLELFHGPTAAFKDFGARFLAECISRRPSSKPRTVLVATSGDTGGAVAGAFHGKPGIEVWVLYPKGKISARQEKQIAGWGGNVRAFAVHGDFDACQRIVKEAMADESFRAERGFISANSINIGRLLPQVLYYAQASLRFRGETGTAPSIVVPTGNLGNAVAALYAKRIGFPVARVHLATNANRAIPDFFSSGRWEPHATIATLANAMDVGNANGFERLRHLYPDLAALRRDVDSRSIGDEEIRAHIREGVKSWGETWCPHTATAVAVREAMPEEDAIVVATAHPAKFETIVEPLIGRSVPVPPPLQDLLGKPSKSCEIEPNLASFRLLSTETR
jgi:threonine synthase